MRKFLFALLACALTQTARTSEPANGAADPAETIALGAFKILSANCFECHGIGKHESDLDLRHRDTALQGGKRGPALEPGKPDQSILYFFVSHRAKPNMPPAPRPRLAPPDLETIKKWIEAGAPWPKNADELLKEDEERRAKEASEGKPITQAERSFWAFQPPKMTTPPRYEGDPFAKSEIDRFVLSKLKEKNLSPSPRASRWELIRRATLDLTGLPPTPSETLAFVFDRSPDAFGKVVDRILASPRYGERWGRHWLDVARYADSNGYEFDYHRPDAWRFRDYVIKAFNDDKPYNRFIIEQLAGDELTDKTTETLIASGFNRLGPTVDNQESEEFRMNELDDMVATTASAFLGMTVGCARCHDHKFDPIRQADYYRLQAVFFPSQKADLPLVAESAIDADRAAREAIDKQIEPLKKSVGIIETPYREEIRKRTIQKLPQDIREAFATDEDKRSEGQKLIVAQAKKTIETHYKYEEMEALFSTEHKEAVKTLKELIGKLEAKRPAPLAVAMGLKDSSAEPPPAHFLVRGSYRSKGPEVKPGAPAVINFTSNELSPPPAEKSTLRRTALAKWIADPRNPLTARVMVNRIWMQHFGRGIVGTPSDFGNAGDRPTNQELLDWLAIKFMESGWSMKAMHRLIMNSAAYQQESVSDPKKAETDPENLYVWRQNPRKLEAESLRDSVLAASGRLNLKAGGPGFLPPITDEMKISIGAALPVNSTDDPNELNRRTVYMYQKRNLPTPMLEVMDLPDSNITCPRRDSSTVPTQALTLFNNEFTMTQAEALAKRLVEEKKDDVEGLIRAASWAVLSRPPSEREIELGKGFLGKEMETVKKDTARADPLVVAMTDYCRVLFNTNEFVYIR